MSAVKALTPSPGSRSRPMAKMQIRVLVSGLYATVDVSGNGSAFIVTDSKATARVFAVWLISVGAFAFAANRELIPPLIAKVIVKRRRFVKPARTSRGDLVFI